mgnify:CR=1 FL=1
MTPELLRDHVQRITMCGDIGDPIYATEFIPIVRYIKQHHFGCSLTIVTNGSYKGPDWWEELGALLHNNDQVTFSVDGWDQKSNEQYRVNSNFESIINGARALRKGSNCRMNWSAIYFSFNEKEMDWIEDLARELGFDTFERVYSSKFDNQYTTNGIDPLKPVGGYFSKARSLRSAEESLLYSSGLRNRLTGSISSISPDSSTATSLVSSLGVMLLAELSVMIMSCCSAPAAR